MTLPTHFARGDLQCGAGGVGISLNLSQIRLIPFVVS
jgi:hypothetical protein